MAPRQSPDELIHRIEREQRAAKVQREYNLESSLAPFRVGSVPYLNAVPLNGGFVPGLLGADPCRVLSVLERACRDADTLTDNDARWVVERKQSTLPR